VGGGIAWSADEAPRVVDFYRRLTEEAPPELAAVCGFRKAPPAPWLHPSVHGKDIVAFFVCHSGDVSDGERLLAPMKRLGTPVGDIVQRRTYVSQQSLLDATQPNGRRYYWKSDYLRAHEPALFDAAQAHAHQARSPHSAVLIFPLAGEIGRVSADHSPMGNRDAYSVFNIAGAWDAVEDDAENIEWTRDAFDDLRRFSTGGTYVNFLTEDEGADRTHAAYGPHFERLAKIKAVWDPTNLFRANRNIAPVGA
jgi:hypothetical protein